MFNLSIKYSTSTCTYIKMCFRFMIACVYISGVKVLLSRRTSRRFVAGRILADIEIKLNFLLSKVSVSLDTALTYNPSLLILFVSFLNLVIVFSYVGI